MKKLLLLVLSVSTLSSRAQVLVQRDPQIEGMVQEVSADSLRAYVQALVGFGTRNTLSTQVDPRRGIGAARLWVQQQFQRFARQSNGRLTALMDSTRYLPDGKRVDTPINLGNVVATLRGTDGADNRIFIISAHLDNMRTSVMDRTGDAPGANDDASGVAALLECARIMSRHAFSATVQFVAFSGEEQGLLGATYMAGKARKEGRPIEAVLNNDIIGSNNSNETNIINNTQVRVFSEGLPLYELEKAARSIRQLGTENDGKARQLARYVKETGERYVDNLQVVLVYRNDRFLRGGDHSPFVENGFAAVRLTEMNENFHHQHQDVRQEGGIQYGDLPQFMDFEYLRKNTALNLATLSNLAKAPAVPAEVQIEVKTLSNATSLRWKAPAAGKVKGYYVLLRETTSPVWQKKFYTPQNALTLPYSKDNYFFAVQSVNESGNESLPVIPAVAR
ncbi:M28 family metallopeptidase [Paraflavisolibacter sp. H34]|uniref:M28 family metallopeptidase n=1 Tax=Huijunlia imazamoxiresistens TaxID=3127457 RepID=UPI003018017B